MAQKKGVQPMQGASPNTIVSDELGNPFLIGIVDSGGVPTFIQSSLAGPFAGLPLSYNAVPTALADTETNSPYLPYDNSNNRVVMESYQMLFNGGTWDRMRGNAGISLFTSAVRNASSSSADQQNYNFRGVTLYVNITVAPGAETVTMKLEGKDGLSGNYVTFFQSAALNAAGQFTYQMFPGNVAGLLTGAASLALPQVWRVTMTHSAGGNWTYSVRANSGL